MLRDARFVLHKGLGFEVCDIGVLLCVMVLVVWFEQVIVSGKLRAQRAKSMKFKDGYMISSGQPVKDYIDSAVRHVLLRQVFLSSILCRFLILFISFGLLILL